MKTILVCEDNNDIFNLAPIKYAWAWKMYNDSIANNWLPSEIPVSGDILCYNKELSEEEKQMFVNVFATLTTSDQAILTNLLERIATNIAAPEIKQFIARQIYEESLHSMSYQYIIEHLGLEENHIYNLYKEVPQIRQKFEFVTIINNFFEEYFSSKHIKSLLYGLIFYYLIFEGVWFYHGFTPIFALARCRKMVNSSEQLQYIMRDECLVPETEVLTPCGWIKVSLIDENTEIAQWHTSGNISFTKPLKISRSFHEKAVEFKNTVGSYSKKVSLRHRFPQYQLKTGTFSVKEAQDVRLHPYSSTPVAGKLNGVREYLTLEESLYIAYQADGYLIHRTTNCIEIRFNLTKERKKERLEFLLNSLNIRFNKYAKNGGKKHIYIYYIPLEEKIKYCKDFSWIDLKDKSYKWCDNFIEEVVLWDGHIRKDTGQYLYCNTNKEAIDIVQAIAHLANYRTNIYITEDKRKNTYKTYYRLSLHNGQSELSCQNIEKTIRDYNNIMYGIEVPSSFVLIRHNNAVCVTGNSMHFAFGAVLIRAIIREYNVSWSEQDIKIITNIFNDALETEKVYAEHVIPNIIGYSAKTHIDHTKFLMDRRLTTLGLPKLFNIGKQIEWLDEMAHIKKEKNFFESRVTEYQQVGTLDFEPTSIEDVLSWK